MPFWEVVGGADKGGILIRAGQDLKSEGYDERLSTGAVVEELALVGERLHYKIVTGTGPPEGWASLKIKGKDLLVPKEMDAGGPAAEGGSVEVDADLKKKIEDDAKAKAADNGKYFPKYKAMYKWPLAEKPKFRVICFHNAGSAESNYTAKKTPFTDFVVGTGVGEIVSLQFPGRENLRDETKHTTVETLCPLLLAVAFDKIADGVPYYVWGHSVGTWVGFEFLMLARKIGLPMPKAAFLNAFPGPHLPTGKRPWRRSKTLNDAAMREELIGWDSTHFDPNGPAGKLVFADGPGGWKDNWEPLMRADFQLYDEYTFKHNGAPKFDFPLHYWHMEGEKYNTADMIQLWGDWTTAKTDFRTFPWGHLTCFYKPDMKKAYFEEITKCLKEYTGL